MARSGERDPVVPPPRRGGRASRRTQLSADGAAHVRRARADSRRAPVSGQSATGGCPRAWLALLAGRSLPGPEALTAGEATGTAVTEPVVAAVGVLAEEEAAQPADDQRGQGHRDHRAHPEHAVDEARLVHRSGVRRAGGVGGQRGRRRRASGGGSVPVLVGRRSWRAVCSGRLWLTLWIGSEDVVSLGQGAHRKRTAAVVRLRAMELTRADGSPLRVLVVDDEQNIAELISMALRYEGFEVTAAHTGTKAVGGREVVRPRRRRARHDAPRLRRARGAAPDARRRPRRTRPLPHRARRRRGPRRRAHRGRRRLRDQAVLPRGARRPAARPDAARRRASRAVVGAADASATSSSTRTATRYAVPATRSR